MVGEYSSIEGTREQPPPQKSGQKLKENVSRRIELLVRGDWNHSS